MLLSVEECRRLALVALERCGLSGIAAEMVVDESIEAELRGRRSHGLRLIPEQAERIGDRKAAPKVVTQAGGCAVLEGGDSLGPVVAREAADLSRELADAHGISFVGVKNKHVFVMAGYHPRRLAAQGYVSIAATVAAARVAPSGGSRPVFGTNPIAFAFPQAGGEPAVLDMAITKIPAADVREARDEGGELPEGVAIDASGSPTTSPLDALAGALLPFGGYKGSGLGFVVELLAGALVGAKSGSSDEKRRGMSFITVKPDALGLSAESLGQRVAGLVRDVNEAGGTYAPGQRSAKLREELLRTGFSVPRVFAEFVGLNSFKSD